MLFCLAKNILSIDANPVLDLPLFLEFCLKNHTIYRVLFCSDFLLLEKLKISIDE